MSDNLLMKRFGNAGVALDTLVALGPMGWELNERGTFFGIPGQMQGPVKMTRKAHLWCPSTHMGDAWEVAEHIASFPGQWFNQHVDHDSMHEEGSYVAQFSDPTGFAGLTGEPISARALTPQLAICWAALLFHDVCVRARAENARG
jgi:hypothetical protein